MALSFRKRIPFESWNDALKSDSHLTYNRLETVISQVETDKEGYFHVGENCEEGKKSEGVISFRRKLNDIRGGGRGSNHQEYSEPNGHSHRLLTSVSFPRALHLSLIVY